MTGLRQIWYRFTLSLLRINSTEAASRIGRNFTKNAELPAVPAASKKGASGKQQLEANPTPPSAARLARIVRVERWRFAPCSFLFIVIALFPSDSTKRLQRGMSTSIAYSIGR